MVTPSSVMTCGGVFFFFFFFSFILVPLFNLSFHHASYGCVLRKLNTHLQSPSHRTRYAAQQKVDSCFWASKKLLSASNFANVTFIVTTSPFSFTNEKTGENTEDKTERIVGSVIFPSIQKKCGCKEQKKKKKRKKG